MTTEERQNLLGYKIQVEETLQDGEAFHTRAHPRLDTGSVVLVLQHFEFGQISQSQGGHWAFPKYRPHPQRTNKYQPIVSGLG